MSTFSAAQTSSAYAFTGLSQHGPHRPGLSSAFVLAADILGLSLMLWAAFGNTIIGRYAVPGGWLRFWFLLPLFLVLYWFFDSYPGVSINPVAEVRSISLANASAFLFIAVMLVLHKLALVPLLICLSACASSSAVILAMRALTRQIGSRFNWWGYPTVLFGSGPVALSLLRKLMSQPHLGLRPVAVIADREAGTEMEGIPIFDFDKLGQIACSGVKHAIVAAPELSQSQFAAVIEQGSYAFPHLILIPNTDSFWKVGAHSRDLVGILGIQVRNNLLDSGSRIVKRSIDLVGSGILTLFTLPLMAVISFLIVVESGFPVFFFQRRLGHKGRNFRVWKFRTMLQDSTDVLDCCLATNSELRKEWTEYQKLRNDPRVTRVGRVLRRTSLDELPQLWNIIKGEMSLVGPRPYLDIQLADNPAAYSAYVKTNPGLTGLWQVSGRNRKTLSERIAYDTYYIRNWSVWLDIYLLARTIGVVFTGDGAY